MAISGIDPAGGSVLPAEYFSAGEALGDVNAQVAAMVVEHARDTRNQAQSAREMEELHLRQEEAREVAELHARADAVRSAATKRGWTQIASGGLTMAAGGTSMAGAGAAKGLSDSEMDRVLTEYGGTTQGLGGTAGVVEGVGELSAASDDAAAETHAAESTAASQRGEQSKRRLEDIKETEEHARELLRTAVDFLRDVNDSKEQTTRAALFRA